ncbi:hypothetical protein [Aestuariivivens insulae]|uniref:hypothetical protein n=1 Tax=Aestuariivivens insulae TaxID=1621988 RepID=UPI001F5A4C4D|nr:hypothetical protein [Aestuariivivens insulae]
MKTIKSFFLFTVFALLLTSCIVNSLYPFYTNDVLFYEPKFEGNWVDQENGVWNVKSFLEVFKEVERDLDKESYKKYSKYNNISYYVYYEKDSSKSAFLVVPFKIKNQLFLDFTPVDDNESLKHINDVYKMHLIGSHALVKLNIDSKENISIKWLSSEKLEALLKANKINIKHEKIGLDEDIVLTASSEELVKFIEKYIASEDIDKWKTDVEFILKRK